MKKGEASHSGKTGKTYAREGSGGAFGNGLKLSGN